MWMCSPTCSMQLSTLPNFWFHVWGWQCWRVLSTHHIMAAVVASPVFSFLAYFILRKGRGVSCSCILHVLVPLTRVRNHSKTFEFICMYCHLPILVPLTGVRNHSHRCQNPGSRRKLQRQVSTAGQRSKANQSRTKLTSYLRTARKNLTRPQLNAPQDPKKRWWGWKTFENKAVDLAEFFPLLWVHSVEWSFPLSHRSCMWVGQGTMLYTSFRLQYSLMIQKRLMIHGRVY
jgi:hypothetical protein